MTDHEGLEAGDELNAEIAVRVMKTHTIWDRQSGTPEQQEWGKLVAVNTGALRGYSDIPDYSTSIEAAFTIVDRLAETHAFYFERIGASRWACFWPFGASREWTPDDGCFAESDALAIARAALLAVAGREG